VGGITGDLEATNGFSPEEKMVADVRGMEQVVPGVGIGIVEVATLSRGSDAMIVAVPGSLGGGGAAGKVTGSTGAGCCD